MSLETAHHFALEIAERIRGVGEVSVRRFFGGAALVANGVQIGFVMKGSVYLRVDDVSRADFAALGASPFTYGTAKRRVTVARYYEVPAGVVEDPDDLRKWAMEAQRAALADRVESTKAR